MNGRSDRITWLLALLVGIALCVFWYSRITGSEVRSDPLATLQMGVNFAHHGVMSLDEQAPHQPTMYREPFPALVIAGMVRGIEAVAGPAPLQDYVAGERARWLKLQNIAWFLLLCGCLAVAVRSLCGSWLAGIATAVLAQAFFFYPGMRSFGVDTLFTDIQSAGVLALASLLAIRAVENRRLVAGILAGAAFGVLALIKAAMLYVSIGFVLFLALLLVLPSRRADRADWLRTLAGFTVALLLVVTPWMLRNERQFGVAAIADRAGLSLYTRMLKDEMTPLEYRGAFFAWTPSIVRPVVGRVLGFSAQDLQPGGSLQRLNRSRAGTPENDAERQAERAGDPDAAIAFYYKGRAERERRTQQAAARGETHPALAADQSLQKDAMQYLREHPWRHLKLTAPYLWRGGLLSFPLLLLAFVVALARRDDRLLWFVLPTFGTVVFYALFTNFEERYGAPLIPLALAAFVAALMTLRSRLPRR
jgi:hypothetical protein